MLAGVDSGAGVSDGNETLGALLERWASKVLPAQSLAPRTLDSYLWACGVLTEDLGTTRLRRLTADQIERCFERRADAGLSRGSLVKIRSVLGKALEYAQRRGLVTSNAARIVELPAQARRTKPGRALTVDQARHLLAVAKRRRLEALWTVMLYLGLRPGEAMGLTWGDVDLERAVIHVRRSLKLERGKLVLDERLKTSRSRRSLDCPPAVIEVLLAHRDRQNKARRAAGDTWDGRHDLVFTTGVGTPLHPRNLYRSFAALTNSAGLGAWHPHELRHTAASIMSAEGVPLERVADVLGHDGTRMTMLVYRHATKATVDGALVMGKALGSNDGPT
jgi:integrase